MKVSVATRKRKRSTAVMVDYYSPDGGRHQRIVGRAHSADELKAVKAKAKIEAKRIEVELADGVHTPNVGEMPIDAILTEFAEHAERCQYTPSTRRTYHDTIKAFRTYLKSTRAKRAKDLTPTIIVDFIGHETARGLAPDTILTRLSRLRRIFRRAVERGTLASDPTRHQDVADVRPRAVPHERVFTDEELAVFLEGTATRPGRDARDYADYYRLLSETGLRAGEALRLRWCDVHFDGEHGDYLRVEAHDGWTPKTKSSTRNVPLTPRVRALLQARLRACATFDPQAGVWPMKWTVKSLGSILDRVLVRVGLESRDTKGQKLRMHSLRHYYATRCVVSGADPATVRDLLGHTSIVTTNRYFNVPQRRLFDAALLAFGDDVSIRAPGAEPPIPITAKVSQKTSQTPAVSSGF